MRLCLINVFFGISEAALPLTFLKLLSGHAQMLGHGARTPTLVQSNSLNDSQ
jgi:hypothetical protein